MAFFPHHKGDLWEYLEGKDTTQNRVVLDSLGADGKYYVQTTMSTMFGGRFRVDSSSYLVHETFMGNFNALRYDLHADSGDTWIVHRVGYTKQARVVSAFKTNVFGRILTVKRIDYVDSSSGLLFETAI
jgi:hypothetical protein